MIAAAWRVRTQRLAMQSMRLIVTKIPSPREAVFLHYVRLLFPFTIRKGL